MISSSVHVELTVGLRRTAQIIAFAMMSMGETLMPAKSGLALRRLTNSIVRVASTSTKMLTCGAVKALRAMACAIALRTPLTRTSGQSGVWMLRNTLACDAWRMTSSRVISPARPVGCTVCRSTPRSFASLRMGGFAITGTAEAAGTNADGAGRDATAAACASPSWRPPASPPDAARRRREATWPLAP
jgi:hypothetical protein